MRSSLLILFFLGSMFLHAAVSANMLTDTLVTILTGDGNDAHKQEKLARLCNSRFLLSSGGQKLAISMIDSLKKYKFSGQQELGNFIQILVYRRNLELLKAEHLLEQSIEMAKLHNESYFLHLFYLNQAYVQTDLGNATSAVYNYRASRKVAEEIGNVSLLVSTDIGISDIYTSIGFYAQAIAYLNQAQDAYNTAKTGRISSQINIYLNKAEAYFKMSQLDSLRHYVKLIRTTNDGSIYTARNSKRLDYFVLILEAKYSLAIPRIKALLTTGNTYYKSIDRWHLAECYYQTGALDSAVSVAKIIIDDKQLSPSTIKLETYKLLAKISQQQKLIVQANAYLELALKESENYSIRLTNIGDIASELRLDRLESSYHAKNLIYEKERTIMIVTIIGAVLGVIAILVSYRNIKQKNRFQKLLHQAQSRELAFINSHQVRKPLANILGLCSLAENKGVSAEEIQQYLQRVYVQAQEMDYKLRDVEQKLNTHSTTAGNLV